MLGLSVLVLSSLVFASVANARCGNQDASWSFGFLYGSDPFNLYASNNDHNDTFPCMRNPIMTCKGVTEQDQQSVHVTSPYIFMPKGQYGQWFMYYEVLVAGVGTSKVGHSMSANQVGYCAPTPHLYWQCDLLCSTSTSLCVCEYDRANPSASKACPMCRCGPQWCSPLAMQCTCWAVPPPETVCCCTAPPPSREGGRKPATSIAATEQATLA